MTKQMEKKKQNEEKNRRNTLAKLGLPPDTPKLENDLEQKKFFAFGTEPAFGIYTGGSLPEFYGEKALDPYGNNEEPVAGEMLNASKSQEYTRLRDGLRKNIPLLKKEHPDYKVMVPWGDPNFLIPFLSDPVLKDQIDGALYDTGVFDRMPEMQLHQTVIHRLWQFRQNWSKYVKDRDPLLVSIEGPCFTGVLNSKGALSERELASYVPRSMLLLGAYGMNRQFSLPGGSAPASYWGEQHYGNGPIGRYATLNPHVLYSTIATMIRHLEPLRFVRPLRLKEKSLYALQFEDVRDPQKKVHFIWTIRGTRPLRIGAPFSAYDLMDNPVDGKDSTITISDMPVIVYGLGADSEALLFPGEPDHSDSQNGEFVTRIANPGDGKWEQTGWGECSNPVGDTVSCSWTPLGGYYTVHDFTSSRWEAVLLHIYSQLPSFENVVPSSDPTGGADYDRNFNVQSSSGTTNLKIYLSRSNDISWKSSLLSSIENQTNSWATGPDNAPVYYVIYSADSGRVVALDLAVCKYCP